LCCTIYKYVGVMYKLKQYFNNQTLRMLYHSLINSRAQYGIMAWGKATSCHLQPISFVLNRAIRCLNTNELVTSKVTSIYKTQKILQLKEVYSITLKWANSCTSMLTLGYRLRLLNTLSSLQMFIRMMQDKSKPDNLLYKTHVQTQALKW